MNPKELPAWGEGVGEDTRDSDETLSDISSFGSINLSLK